MAKAKTPGRQDVTDKVYPGLSSEVAATIVNLAGQWAFDLATETFNTKESDQWDEEFERQFIRFRNMLLNSLQGWIEFQDRDTC